MVRGFLLLTKRRAGATFQDSNTETQIRVTPTPYTIVAAAGVPHTDTVGESFEPNSIKILGSGGRSQAVRAAKREIRVGARGRPCSQAAIRSRSRAAAV